MTFTYRSVLLAAALLLSAGAGSSSAVVGPSCVPHGAQLIAVAGSTKVYAYAGGPRMVCGAFGDPIELATGIGGLPTVTDSCVVYTASGGSDKYQIAEADIAIFNLKDRTYSGSQVQGRFPDEVRIGRVLIGPGCTAAAEMGTTFWRLDARGASRIPADGTLEALAAELQVPAAGAVTVTPPQAASTSTLTQPARLSKRSYVGTLTLAFNRVPDGVTVFVDGREVAIALPSRQRGDLRPYLASVRLPARVSTRLKAGGRASVESIVCRGGCTKQVQMIKVTR